MVDAEQTPTPTHDPPVPFISCTTTWDNRLKEWELSIRGCDTKLDLEGDVFIEWKEAVATHVHTIPITMIFQHGPSITSNRHLARDFIPAQKLFFECYDVIALENAKELDDSFCTATGASAATAKCKDECFIKHRLNYLCA